MKFDWKDTLQVISNLAILVGIILVLIELRQNQTLTRAQLGNESVTDIFNFRVSLFGEAPDKLIARACFEPDLLTDEDKLRLNRILSARLQLAQRNQFLEGITQSGIDWEGSFRIAFAEIFSTEYGKDWYKNLVGESVNPVTQIGNEVLASTGPMNCLESGTH